MPAAFSLSITLNPYQVEVLVCAWTGFKSSAGSLPSTKDAVQVILHLIYGNEKPAELQTWEKRERNAEIYRRYLAGDDSVVLGRAYGLGDWRIRDIIERERKRGSQ